MTTAVVIRSPSPNDQDVLVQRQVVGVDGSWENSGPPERLSEGVSLADHLHRGKRLVVVEATRKA